MHIYLFFQHAANILHRACPESTNPTFSGQWNIHLHWFYVGNRRHVGVLNTVHQIRFTKPKIAPCYKTFLKVTIFGAKFSRLATLTPLTQLLEHLHCPAALPCFSFFHSLAVWFYSVASANSLNNTRGFTSPARCTTAAYLQVLLLHTNSNHFSCSYIT